MKGDNTVASGGRDESLVIDTIFGIGDVVPGVGFGARDLHQCVGVENAVGNDKVQIDNAVAAL